MLQMTRRPALLLTLLKERFGLAMRAESRERPVYVLTLARADGTLGPHLRRSTTDCTGRGSLVVAGRETFSIVR
jgi:uncharacterized protein (TIGR03435 family)